MGLAFKPHTDDLREAPAIDIARWLMSNGIKVRAHDPVAMNNALALLPQLTCCVDPYEVAEGADVLFLATEWPLYLDLDWAKMARLLRGRKVLDGRNSLDGPLVASHGLQYESFGRLLSEAEANPQSDGESSPEYLAAA